MVAVYRGQVLTQSDLNWYITNPQGQPISVSSISYEIQDLTDPDNPVVRVPETDALPNNFAPGSYYASWTVPLDEPEETHKVIWKWKATSGSPERCGEEEFEVKADGSSGSSDPFTYITPEDLYCEGVPRDVFDVEFLTKRIKKAKDYVERLTCQWFEPRTLTLLMDGTGHRLLDMPYSIIDVEKIEFKINNDGGWDDVNLNNFSVYDLLKLLENRDYPRIKISELLDSSIFTRTFIRDRFPEGTQNIRITGRFGYVEQDLTTPEPIKDVMIMLVRGLLAPIGGSKSRKKFRGNRLLGETSDGHSYRLSQSMAAGVLTGDPQIDQILQYYTNNNLKVEII